MSKGKITLIVALALLASLAVAQSWSYTFQIVPEVGYEYDLTMAMTAGATDGFDAFLDVPYFTPPDGKGAFFPLDDPANPAYTKLQTDARGIVSGAYTYWVSLPEGFYGLDREAVWDTTLLPDPILIGSFFIAALPFDTLPEDLDESSWVDMSTVEEITFSAIQRVAIRFMPTDMVDSIAPYVEGFNPFSGQAGIDPAASIKFDVVDSRAGVDAAAIDVLVWYDGDTFVVADSEMVLDPIVGGYRVTIDPLEGTWPESTQVNYSVSACDLASPTTNCMTEDSVVYFTTRVIPPDLFPPYFDNIYPADGAMDVDVSTLVQLIIKDSETGVDSSTIVFLFDGDTIGHDDLTIVESGVGSDWYSVTYAPPADLDYDANYDVSVYAEDYWGNDSTITWAFTTEGAEDLPEFSWNLKTLSIVGSDTSESNLYIGLDNLGTDGYDSGVDVPQFLFPGAPRGYFPLLDVTHPEVPALSRDVRSTASGIKQWTIDVFEPTGTLQLIWDNSALPVPTTVGSFQFAVIDSIGYPVDWVSMESYDFADFTASQVVMVRFLPGGEDTLPPVVRAINMDGEGPGGLGYDPSTALTFEVVDYGTGVDVLSVVINVDYVDVTADCDRVSLSNGFRYTYIPDPSWAPNTDYVVEVTASDNELPANTIDPAYTWEFSTGPAGCSPEFELPLTFTWGTGAGESEAITFGTDGLASMDYDAGIDQIMPPPMGAGFHFTSDEAPPANRLIKDMRNNCDRPNIWQIDRTNTTVSSVTVTWPSSPVFADTSWDVVYKVLPVGPAPTTVDSTWDVLYDADSIYYSCMSNYLYIALASKGESADYYNITGNINITGTDDFSGIRVYLDGGTFRTTDSLGAYEFLNVPMVDHVLTFEDPAAVFCPHPSEPGSLVVTGSIPDEFVVAPLYEMIPCGSRVVYGVGTVMGVPEDYIYVNLVGVGYDEGDFTDPSGYYEFSGVLPGTYSLYASRDGYRSWDTLDFEVDLADVEINFDLNSTTVMVCGTGSLEGVPSAGITVDGVGVSSPVVTDTAGAYCAIVNIGMATICATYPGYGDVCTTLTIPETGITGLNFDLDPVPVPFTVAVDLGCEASDESGASVTLVGFGTETTPTSGVVNFADVPWGYYTLEVSKEYHKTMTIDSVHIVAPDTVEVELCCLEPVTDLVVTGEVVERPTTEPLMIELAWTEPDTDCCMPAQYYIYRSESPFIDEAAPGVTLIDSVLYGTAVYEDETVDDGVTYYYDIIVMYACDSYYSPLAGNDFDVSETTEDPAAYLVIDWDNGATPCDGGTMGVGEWWVDMLEATGLGLTEDVSVTCDSVADPLLGYDLSDYELVVVALGINDADNTELPATALAALEEYRISGDNMIIEGPDFGQDYASEDLFENLNLTHLHDGAADFNVDVFYGLPAIMHNPGIPELWLDYADSSSADHFIDILATTSPMVTAPVCFDQDTVARTFLYNAASQVIVSTIYLGGIVDGVAPFTQLRAASGYLWALGIANTGVKEINAKLPSEFALAGNYPNPFNPVTTVVFDVPRAADVEIAVFDITGKRVQTLVDERLDGGTFEVTWNASNMPSGVYFARMISGDFHATQKVMLLK